MWQAVRDCHPFVVRAPNFRLAVRSQSVTLRIHLEGGVGVSTSQRKDLLMAGYGYGVVPDRGFVAFEPELEEGAWSDVVTKKYEEAASESAAALLSAPQAVVWKVRLRGGIAGVLAALGATSLVELDAAWDATQRRLFHRIAVAVDDPDRAVRAAADRLTKQLLAGTGTGQTIFDLDDEVDFGRQQVALTQKDGLLAADAAKLKLGDVLADVAKTTEALAKGLGRATGSKRRAPSRVLREAVAECAGAFNGVHGDLAWFLSKTPPGADRDRLAALAAPLEALLSRHAQPAAAPAESETPEPPAAPTDKPTGT